MYHATVVGISFSPRDESTAYCVRQALEAAGQVPGVETIFYSVRGKKIGPCLDCGACLRKDSDCVVKDDFQELLSIYTKADGMILGSPVYGMNGAPQMYNFHSRLRSFFSKPGKSDLFYQKVGAGIAVGGSRNGGQEMVLLAIHNYLLAGCMTVVGGPFHSYSGAAVWSQDGGAQGAAADGSAMENVKKLGHSVAIAALSARIGKQALLAEGYRLSL